MKEKEIRAMDEAQRKQAEASFHDDREALRRHDPAAHDAYYTNRRFYRTAGKSEAFLENWLRANCAGKQVLDYCCGTGQTSLAIARAGMQVNGVDISAESIASAQSKMAAAGVADFATFAVMDAEKTAFAPNTFDVIICNGVLHHLNLHAAYAELARILKPNGVIVCKEALAHNPVIHWYRQRTPHLRTMWEVDHILTVPDIQRARPFFKNIDIRFFHLASIAAIPFINKPGFDQLLTTLNWIDDGILKLPGIQQLAWQAIFFLRKT